eukprot:scaffold16492_cov72-Skeletonema_dohrnii-CCMP3373.AAC.5
MAVTRCMVVDMRHGHASCTVQPEELGVGGHKWDRHSAAGFGLAGFGFALVPMFIQRNKGEEIIQIGASDGSSPSSSPIH